MCKLSVNETDDIMKNIQWKIEKAKRVRVKTYEEKLNALPLKDMDDEIYLLHNINKFNEKNIPQSIDIKSV